MAEDPEPTCTCQQCGVSLICGDFSFYDICASAMIDEIKFTTFDPENADDRRIVNMFLPENEQF